MKLFTKKNFYNKLLEDYYKIMSITLDEFCATYTLVAPIFGELKVEINNLDNENKEIIFIDKDKINTDIDMSGISLRLHIDKDGYIILADPGVPFLTAANKDIILFTSFLIGKKIIL